MMLSRLSLGLLAAALAAWLVTGGSSGSRVLPGDLRAAVSAALPIATLLLIFCMQRRERGRAARSYGVRRDGSGPTS